MSKYAQALIRSWFTPKPKVTKRFVHQLENEIILHEELGSGRYGIVRVGTRPGDPTNRRLAVKCVPKSRSTIHELANEIKCLEKVSGHPNCMQIIDSFEDKTQCYIITPLYSGGELFDRIVTQRVFTERDASKNMLDLLSAISHLHSKSIVHRDVKPENLLYSSADPSKADLVLVDFGMSREFEAEKWMDLQCGSPSYVAPEVLARRYNEQCDIWSCGIILHILLVGKTPFGNGTDDEILSKVENFNSLDVESKEFEHISVQAKDLLCGLLNKNLKQRLSPQKALAHPWFSMEHDYSAILLNSALENMKEFNKYRRLKRAAIRVIAELARDEESAKNLSSLMANLERDSKGRVKLADLATIISIPMDGGGIRVSSTGMVDPKEIIASALAKSIYLDEEYLLRAFKRFDVSGDGKIDKQELAQALGKDPKLDQDLVLDAMKHADKDGNGYITFEEFANVVREQSSTAATDTIKKREKTLNV
jgi:calcium-dependent protein kinase